MRETIEYIKLNLNHKRLEDISTSVIMAYKNSDTIFLKTCSDLLGLDDSENTKKMFYKIIRQLHPDKLPVLQNEFYEAEKKSDVKTLERIKSVLNLNKAVKQKRSERFEYTHTENWAEDSFDSNLYSEYDAESEVFENEDLNGSFIEAVKYEIFGNHDFHIEPADLSQIDGGLDVSFYSIQDITGIEFCRNLNILDISGNMISNIHDISHLTQLEELYASDNSITDITCLAELNYLEIIDISNNDVEDVSPLLNLSALKFVNISQNPVTDYSILQQLEKDGVLIIK